MSATAAGFGFRRPSAVPGFGPAFGVAAAGITLLVLVPLAALVARGLTNRQIAAELSLSHRTIGAHVAAILAKRGFATRAQIAAWAVAQGMAATPAG